MRKSILVFACCCLIMVGCSKKEYVQDENLAIDISGKFIKAIMTNQYQEAYDAYLSPGIKFGPKATLDYFKADWDAIIDKYGQLNKATFDGWQTVSGKRALQVYYLVKHENVEEPVNYHFVLEGYKKTGYTIFLIDIGNEQKYPPHLATAPEIQKKEEIIEILP